jgi:hypothetical protein
MAVGSYSLIAICAPGSIRWNTFLCRVVSHFRVRTGVCQLMSDVRIELLSKTSIVRHMLATKVTPAKEGILGLSWCYMKSNRRKF